MELTLSPNSSINTVLSNEAGEALYSVTTPWRLSRRTSTIYKHFRSENGGECRKEELARIHWHCIRSSRLVYGGQIYEMSSFMKRSRLGSARTFLAPDGKSYKWRLGTSTSRLEADDGSSRTVVKHRQRNIFRGLQNKAALQVDESVLPILDLVVVTWVYAERRRRQQQRESAG